MKCRNNRNGISFASALIISAAVIMGCGCTGEQSGALGDLGVSVSGGASIREGFPHSEGEVRHAFADGWSIEYSKYIVSMGHVRLTDPATDDEVAFWANSVALELKGSPNASADIVTLEDVPAIRHNFQFAFVPVGADTDPGNVDSEYIDIMREHGWSLLVEGKAVHRTRGQVEFSFGFPISTLYFDCINGRDGSDGVSVESRKTTGAFVYSHAIHMFWSTLAAGDEALRFDAFAALRGDEDFITEEDLKLQNLNDLRDEDGNPLRDESGKPLFYNDNGRLRPGQQTLYHFVLEAMRDSAHFNGVGLCKMKRL